PIFYRWVSNLNLQFAVKINFHSFYGNLFHSYFPQTSGFPPVYIRQIPFEPSAVENSVENVKNSLSHAPFRFPQL
ncbi:hypothetical protein, partial [Neglectibacter timonensis]